MGTTDTPRVYVASLADYNAGVLHGAWIDCTDPATMGEQVAAMLAASPTALESGIPAEEWRIDYYDDWHGVNVGEWDDFERLCSIAAGIVEHGPAFAAWISAGYDPDGDFADAYQGEWDNARDFAMHLADELGAIPADYSWPTSCIDWDQAARELMMDYTSMPAPGGGVFVFRY